MERVQGWSRQIGLGNCLQHTVNCFQYNVCGLCRCEPSNQIKLLNEKKIRRNRLVEPWRSTCWSPLIYNSGLITAAIFELKGKLVSSFKLF